MWLKPESALTRRDLRIHEAAHFVVGTGFGLPMQPPEIFADGSGGIARFDRVQARRLAARPLPELSEKMLMDLEKTAGLNIAATFLAGYCAEAIAGGDDPRVVYGSRTSDIARAGQALMQTRENTWGLEIAWTRARSVLTEPGVWAMVEEIAELIPLTDGTHDHAPLRFLH